jgi:hypothetical protein
MDTKDMSKPTCTSRCRAPRRQRQALPCAFTVLTVEFGGLKIGIVGGGVQLGPLGTAATNGLLCQPRVIMMMENWWYDWQGKPKYSEKTCPNAALSTINPTCCPDANPGRRDGKPATNRLSYGTAYSED